MGEDPFDEDTGLEDFEGSVKQRKPVGRN